MQSIIKVTFFSTFPPDVCGIGNYTYSLSKALQDQGIKVSVMTKYQGKGKYIYDGISCYGCNYPDTSIHIFKKQITVPLRYLQEKPDILHYQYSHGIYGATFHLFSALPIILKRKYVITIHEPPTINRPGGDYIPEKLDILIEKKFYKHASALLFLSEHAKEDALNYFGFNESDINYEVIPCAGTLPYDKNDTFKINIEETARKLRERIGAEFILFCPGLVSAPKNYHLVIEALPMILEKIGDIKLVIGGAHPERKEALKYDKALRDMVKQKRLEDKVIFTGIMDKNEYPAYVAAADLLVLPYSMITQSSHLFNAVLFGTPVLASDFPGFKNPIKKYNAGRILTDLSPSYIADRVVDILYSKINVDTELFLKECSWEKIGNKHVELYEKIFKS